MRLMKWIAPLAAMAMMISWSGSSVRADDPAVKAAVGTITGTVTDKDGKPVGSVTVNLLPPPPAKANKAPAAPKAAIGDKTLAAKGDKAAKGEKKAGAAPIATTTTAADGTYTLSNVAVGDYLIEAGGRKDPNGYAHQNVSVKEGDKLTVALKLVVPKPKAAN